MASAPAPAQAATMTGSPVSGAASIDAVAVRTAEQFEEAALGGAAHIVITDHLDLTTLQVVSADIGDPLLPAEAPRRPFRVLGALNQPSRLRSIQARSLSFYLDVFAQRPG